MEEILCRIAGNTILSKIYYNNKFNQLSLDEVQRRFTTHLRSWEEDTNIKDYHLFLRLNQNFFKEQ